MIPIRATMTARIWKINVAVGDEVEKATTLLVLEAMKMEIAVFAPEAEAIYTVSRIAKEIGDIVEPGDLLFMLEPKD